MQRIVLALAVFASLAALGAAVPLALADGEATPTKLTLNASEFKFRPARVSAAAGRIDIVLVNRGRVRHDLRVAGRKTLRIAGGKRSKALRFTLRAGRYPFLCTVPGHAAAGMRGVLTVKPAPPPTTETTE